MGMAGTRVAASAQVSELYLELMKRALTGLLEGEVEVHVVDPDSPMKRAVARVLAAGGFTLARVRCVSPEERARGEVWP